MTKLDSEKALHSYVLDLRNHKLEKLGNKYAVIRKSKKWSFSINFEVLKKLGFAPDYIGSHNNKDELYLNYVGDPTNELKTYDDALEYLRKF